MNALKKYTIKLQNNQIDVSLTIVFHLQIHLWLPYLLCIISLLFSLHQLNRCQHFTFFVQLSSLLLIPSSFFLLFILSEIRVSCILHQKIQRLKCSSVVLFYVAMCIRCLQKMSLFENCEKCFDAKAACRLRFNIENNNKWIYMCARRIREIWILPMNLFMCVYFE